MTQNNSVEYLNRVLDVWSEFCSTHKLFESSIRDVLLRISFLENENEELRNTIEALRDSSINDEV